VLLVLCADNLMDMNSFIQLVSEFRREGDSEEEILEAFRVFDPQFSGVVSVAQFRQVMMNYGERLCENEVDELIALADVDRKGDIRYMGELRATHSLFQIHLSVCVHCGA